MKKFSLFTVFAMCLISCEEKTPTYNPELKMDDLKREILNDKNDESYGVFLDVSGNDSLNYEPLAFSLIMAEEDNPRANFFVFEYMVAIFNHNEFEIDSLKNLSEANKNFALYYLKRGAKMNEFSSQIYLEEIYRRGIGIEKNEKKADSILSIIKKDHKSYVPDYELK